MKPDDVSIEIETVHGVRQEVSLNELGRARRTADGPREEGPPTELKQPPAGAREPEQSERKRNA